MEGVLLSGAVLHSFNMGANLRLVLKFNERAPALSCFSVLGL